MLIYSVTCTVGTGDGEVRGRTVAEVIDFLCRTKGKEFEGAIFIKGTRKIFDRYIIMVNGEKVDIDKGLGKKSRRATWSRYSLTWAPAVKPFMSGARCSVRVRG